MHIDSTSLKLEIQNLSSFMAQQEAEQQEDQKRADEAQKEQDS